MVLSIYMLFISVSEIFSSPSTAVFKSTIEHRNARKQSPHQTAQETPMAFLTRHFVCQFQFPRNAQTTKTTPCSTTDTFFWQKWLPLSLKTNKSFTNPWAWSAHEEIRSRYIYNNLHALGEPNTVAESMVVPAPELCLLTTAATELIHRTLQELKEKEQETTVSTQHTNFYMYI